MVLGGADCRRERPAHSPTFSWKSSKTYFLSFKPYEGLKFTSTSICIVRLRLHGHRLSSTFSNHTSKSMESRVESSTLSMDYGDTKERGGGGEEGAGEEEEVMSEVHIGCPPGISGPHISRFNISLPPGTSYPVILAVTVVFVFWLLLG